MKQLHEYFTLFSRLLSVTETTRMTHSNQTGNRIIATSVEVIKGNFVILPYLVGAYSIDVSSDVTLPTRKTINEGRGDREQHLTYWNFI